MHVAAIVRVVPYCPNPVTLRRSKTLTRLSTGVSVCLTLAQQQPEEVAQKLNPLLSPLLLPPEFHIIVCGLDSIIARRWMNGMLVGKKQQQLKDCHHCWHFLSLSDVLSHLVVLLDFSPELWRWSSGSELHHSSHRWRNGGLQRKRSCHSARHDCLYRLYTGALPTAGLFSSPTGIGIDHWSMLIKSTRVKECYANNMTLIDFWKLSL